MIKFKKSKNKQFYFVVVARNNKTIVTSEMYTTKRACENGAAVLKSLFQPRKEHIRGLIKANSFLLQDSYNRKYLNSLRLT